MSKLSHEEKDNTIKSLIEDDCDKADEIKVLTLQREGLNLSQQVFCCATVAFFIAFVSVCVPSIRYNTMTLQTATTVCFVSIAIGVTLYQIVRLIVKYKRRND